MVGSYEQIAEALLDYVAILLIRGYDPEGDAIDYVNIIGLVREQTRDHRSQVA
jgi:hypothetical protein